VRCPQTAGELVQVAVGGTEVNPFPLAVPAGASDDLDPRLRHRQSILGRSGEVDLVSFFTRVASDCVAGRVNGTGGLEREIAIGASVAWERKKPGGAMVRKLAAELLGTGLLVYFAVGVATLSFGFGIAGSSFAAGVVATAFAFGLVLLALAYVLGPISGCHINPAVTIGAWLSGRVPLVDAAGYWVAQFVGGILGALLLGEP
jgi:hypothetical protein